MALRASSCLKGLSRTSETLHLEPLFTTAWMWSVNEGRRKTTALDASLRFWPAEQLEVDPPNYWGETPLYIAVKRRHPQAVELLLAAGATTKS